MNTHQRGLRLLCPQGCGATLAIPLPTLAEVHELPADTSIQNLNTVVGRNVVGAVLTHCVYSCTAISDGHPMMHVVGNPLPDLGTTTTSPSSTPSPTHPEWSMTNQRRK
jgi:hypothetical protein